MVKTSARGCDACTLLRSNHLSVRMRMSCAHDTDEVYTAACHLCANFALATAPDSPLPLRCTTLFTRRKPGEPKKKCVRAAAFTTHDGSRTLTPAEVLAGAESMMGLKPEHRRELMLVDGKSRKPEHEKRKRKPKAGVPSGSASGSSGAAPARKLKLVGSRASQPGDGAPYDDDEGEEEDELYDSEAHGDESGDADVENSRFDPLALYTTSTGGAASSSSAAAPSPVPGGSGARPRKRARNESGATDGDSVLLKARSESPQPDLDDDAPAAFFPRPLPPHVPSSANAQLPLLLRYSPMLPRSPPPPAAVPMPPEPAAAPESADVATSPAAALPAPEAAGPAPAPLPAAQPAATAAGAASAKPPRVPWNKGLGKGRRRKDKDGTPLPPPPPPVVTQTAGMPITPRRAPKAEPGSLMASPRGEVSFKHLRVDIEGHRSSFFAPLRRLWVQENDNEWQLAPKKEFLKDEWWPSDGPAVCTMEPSDWQEFIEGDAPGLSKIIRGTGDGKALCATALKTLNVRLHIKDVPPGLWHPFVLMDFFEPRMKDDPDANPLGYPKRKASDENRRPTGVVWPTDPSGLSLRLGIPRAKEPRQSMLPLHEWDAYSAWWQPLYADIETPHYLPDRVEGRGAKRRTVREIDEIRRHDAANYAYLDETEFNERVGLGWYQFGWSPPRWQDRTYARPGEPVELKEKSDLLLVLSKQVAGGFFGGFRIGGAGLCRADAPRAEDVERADEQQKARRARRAATRGDEPDSPYMDSQYEWSGSDPESSSDSDSSADEEEAVDEPRARPAAPAPVEGDKAATPASEKAATAVDGAPAPPPAHSPPPAPAVASASPGSGSTGAARDAPSQNGSGAADARAHDPISAKLAEAAEGAAGPGTPSTPSAAPAGAAAKASSAATPPMTAAPA